MATKDTGGTQRSSKRNENEVDDAAAQDETASDVKERHEKLADDVDSVLDEIDEVLEENAEDFVRGFVQKGGE